VLVIVEDNIERSVRSVGVARPNNKASSEWIGIPSPRSIKLLLNGLWLEEPFMGNNTDFELIHFHVLA